MECIVLSWSSFKNGRPKSIASRWLSAAARQVGKTWLMKAFGAAEYESVVYINFDNNERMRNLFEGSLAVERLVTGLELYAGHKIDPANTLLIFDEVQEVPTALTSLKYFNEDAPHTRSRVNHLCREPFGRSIASRDLFPSWKSRVS